MAKKPLAPLNFIDIVTRADADLIREALAAREKIDDLLVIREEAYRKIAEVENSIEDLVGQEKVFQFDPPPYSVAGMKGAQPYKPKPKVEEEAGSTGVSPVKDSEEQENSSSEVDEEESVKPSALADETSTLPENVESSTQTGGTPVLSGEPSV